MAGEQLVLQVSGKKEGGLCRQREEDGVHEWAERKNVRELIMRKKKASGGQGAVGTSIEVGKKK